MPWVGAGFVGLRNFQVMNKNERPTSNVDGFVKSRLMAMEKGP